MHSPNNKFLKKSFMKRVRVFKHFKFELKIFQLKRVLLTSTSSLIMRHYHIRELVSQRDSFGKYFPIRTFSSHLHLAPSFSSFAAWPVFPPERPKWKRKGPLYDHLGLRKAYVIFKI